MPTKKQILWIDDEIELLRPHIILLQQRGYDVDTASNGEDAIEMVKQKSYDLIFLDEMMVGISGLETLPELKEIDPGAPVVMVTKNEAESLMEDAIGRKIDDYLTKPVNPAQILMTLKKFLESNRISSEAFTSSYLQGFNELARRMLEPLDWEDWKEVYLKLTKWSMELDKFPESNLSLTLQDQRKDANAEFSKFVEKNYVNWINKDRKDANPLLSPHVIDKYLAPMLQEKGEDPVFLFVVDCMRYDQWLIFEEALRPYYTVRRKFYSSILPTATQFCRNSLFAGLYPSEIKKFYPQYWNDDTNSEEHKLNAYEKELVEAWLQRRKINLRNTLNFIKIFDTDFGKKVEKDITKYLSNHLTIVVLNAVDMIAHSRSDYAILKEIAPDEAAYRSLARSWFNHSSFFGMLKALSTAPNVKIMITTDHGSIRCMRGVKVLGDKETSTNLRYKFGRNVKADSRHAIQIKDPEEYKLPRTGITVNNIIAKEDYYFVYPTDYNHFLNRYKDSFQHGGVSLEEMIVPITFLTPRT